MKFLVGCLFSAFMACLFSTSYAQVSANTIEGRVLTENNLPAEGSTIVLLKLRDSSIVNSAVADKTGAFKFSKVNPDSYLLLISNVGYKKFYTGPYRVKASQSFIVGDIVLKAVVKQLQEVAITSSRPEIEARPGKIILNVQNSLLAAGNSAFDILRQAPGVRVSNNNNISIIGRQNALVTIDGKPTNLTGDDLAGMLKSMQANTIDYIELVTSGSAKYDASGGGIINIVMKKGKNSGANATVTATAGYGKYYKASGGIVFNDRTDKFNVFGVYNYSDNKTFHNIVTDRVINFNNTVSNYDVDYNNVQKTHNNNFNFGADYFISAGHTIGFLVNGYARTDNFIKDNNLRISNQSVLDSIITANSVLNRNISSINYNLNYNGKLDKAGKTLSADFNYTTYHRSSAEYITNHFSDAAGSAYRPADSLQNLSPSNIHIWLSKVDFYDPVSKNSKIEAGAKFSDVTSNNDLIFGPFANGAYQSDPRFSNHFVYTEMVNAAYVNFQNKFKKFDLVTGLRAEQTAAKGNSLTSGQIVNSNYTDLFPQAMLTYKYDAKKEYSLSYNRGIRRPAYEDLNPFLYYIDVYDYGSGNPNLKPEYTNSIELSYNYNKSMVTTLYASVINNAYEFPFYEQNDTSKLNITTRKNLGNVYNYGIRFNTPVVFTSWWTADFNIDASYQRYVAYPANGNLNKGTQDIYFSTKQYFIISSTLSADLSGHYESPTFYGVNQIKANYEVDAAIGKQLFNKRGSIRLNFSDIFNTLRDRGYTNYENLNIATTDKKESQVIRLTFTYRFGKNTVKSASTHSTGNEEEQTRTKSTVSN